MTGAVALEAVTFRYPGAERPVFEDMSLRVGAGEFLSVVGPSGCGKSTLLRLISGLSLPSSGAVTIGGTPVTGPGPGRAIVFQQGGGLFPWMTARGNVAFALRKANHGMEKAETVRRAEQALCQVGLGEDMHRYPTALSGGMAQRVAIARALAMGAELLLLDEPFGALDPKNRHALQQLLLDLWQTERKTVVLVTHDIDEAILLSDRIAFLQPGGVRLTLPVTFPRPRQAGQVLTSAEGCAVRKRLIGLFYQYGEAVGQRL